MISRKIKLKLLELLSNKEITKNQFKTIVKIGFPAPVFFEFEGEANKKTKKNIEIESLFPIYRKLGQQISGIVFVKIKDKELVQKLQNE